MAQLRLRTGHDFSGYREATILRRIARRMQLVHLDTLPAYLNRLRQDGDEIDALDHDMLIHVTEFFRDRDAWATLAHEIVPKLFADTSNGDSVRAWAVGCATGEEAYSLAIVLLEYASTLHRAVPIQIFASDLGKTALDFARKGIYPEAIASMSPKSGWHAFSAMKVGIMSCALRCASWCFSRLTTCSKTRPSPD
ncbi:MAG: CheR family methyltransferase [Microthrixaceae bacterium]